MTIELDVPGVPETLLSQALVSRLPANLAPAPWTATCQAVIWGCRGGAAATEALPPALRTGRARAVIGGLVRYSDTPVGSYDEVFGIVVGNDGRRPWGSVVFMAVDSETSLVGGRSNWAMPKTLASFEGAPDTGMAAMGVEASWRVSATPHALGLSLPYRSKGTARQEFPDGTVRSSALDGRFRMRPALVSVEVSSDGPLPTWLRPGRHLGGVSPEMTFSLGEPRRTPSG
jgi:hypothetical protein